MHRKHQRILIGLAMSISLGILYASNAFAIDKPEISISIPTGTVNSATLSPKDNTRDWASFSIPVNITISKSTAYQISVYRSCTGLDIYDPTGSKGLVASCNNGSLVDLTSGNALPTISTASNATLPDMNNAWGYRWKLEGRDDDPNASNYYNTEYTTNELQKSFAAIPTSLDTGKLMSIGRDSNGNSTSDGWVDLTNPSSNHSASETLTLEFGASVDGNIASGNYQGTVAVTVIAKPEQVATFGHIHYMQEMTPSECAKVTIPTGENSIEGYLEDKRDGKLYKVAKLKDNRCWMIQNLALEGSLYVPDAKREDYPTDEAYNTAQAEVLAQREAGKVVLTSELTDLAEGDTYEMPASTTSKGNAQLRMYNGSHLDNEYDTYGFWANDEYPNGVPSPDTATTPNLCFAGDPNWNGSRSISCDGQNSGGYYTWLVATAQEVAKDGEDGEETATSICPQGWKLPSINPGHELQSLIKAYNGNTELLQQSWRRGTPGLFVSNGTLRYSGYSFVMWTNTMKSKYYAYRSAGLTYDPSNNSAISDGQSVRCVAR